MPDINQKKQKTEFITVDFILHPEKQRTLINLIAKQSPLNKADIAKLLNISDEKLNNVILKKDFLNQKEARDLAKYFCIFSGS